MEMDAVLTCLAIIALSWGIPQLLGATRHIGFRAGMAIFRFNFKGFLLSPAAAPRNHQQHSAASTFFTSVRRAASGVLTTTSITKSSTRNTAPTSIAENQLHNPSIATVAVSEAVSRLQSALNSAKTTLTGDIEAILPVHCSISMKTFCTDLMRNMSLQELPMLMSKLVTEHVKGPQKARGSSNEVTIQAPLSCLQNCVIAGMLFVLVLATIAVLQVLESIVRSPHVLPRTAMYLTFGVMCLGLLATGISWILQLTLQSISFVTCFCAFLLIIFGAIQKKLVPNFLWISILGG